LILRLLRCIREQSGGDVQRDATLDELVEPVLRANASGDVEGVWPPEVWLRAALAAGTMLENIYGLPCRNRQRLRIRSGLTSC
jgi:hypothetical protein